MRKIVHNNHIFEILKIIGHFKYFRLFETCFYHRLKLQNNTLVLTFFKKTDGL